MGRRSKSRRQQPIKGFRPGKEPPHLKKQRAKAQLGKDATWAQKQMVEAVGDRSPEEVQTMMARWTTALLAAWLVLAILGAVLYGWSIVAGIVVHVLAALVAFLWFRVRKQRDQLVALARSLGGR